MNYAQRRDKLAASLDADVLLVSHPVNVRYLSGFTGDASYLLLGRGTTLLVSDARFTGQIADECPDLPVHIRGRDETTLDALGAVIAKHGLRSVAFEANRMTVADFEGLKEKVKAVDWKPAKGSVESLRAVKDADEVGVLRRAIKVAELVFDAFRAELRPGDTEYEMADRVEFLVRRHGGRQSSFDPITAVGDRSALAHAPPTGRRLAEGGWLLVDWGAVVDGYRSDLTRVLIPDTQQVRSADSPDFDRGRLETVCRAVDEARRRAIAMIRPGVATKAVDAEARAALAEAGLAEQFTHGLGHGIGLEVHEKPGLRTNSDEVLEAGMVVTVEPGVYVSGWGGVRIEDDVLVTPDGCEVLSSLPRDFAAALV
jgi:Xaa-Pro aminopeptidase